jgi:beta-mannosidase
MLWAGDNEVDFVYLGWGGQRRRNPNENVLTRKVLPEAVRLHDYTRPYLPSSPYVDDYAFQSRKPISEDHLWGPRDYFKSDFYRDNKARFVSETGYHGCPSIESIRKFITPEKVWPYHNNSEWILHSTDQNGNDDRVMLMEKQIRQLFGFVPTDPDLPLPEGYVDTISAIVRNKIRYCDSVLDSDYFRYLFGSEE